MSNNITTLFRRNNKGQPCYWQCSPHGGTSIKLHYGIVNMKGTVEYINTKRKIEDAINSMIRDKRKSGYLTLEEIKDNVQTPVEGELYNYLNTYLDHNRIGINGILLPMLAKTYDNKDNKLFKDNKWYMGQWKINGLRCSISVNKTDDLFNEYKLIFTSREGIVWKTLTNLENHLKDLFGEKILKDLYFKNIILDGEIYLPGYTVNDINHFVKDDICDENKLLQFWCYDLAIENNTAFNRQSLLQDIFGIENILYDILTKEDHINNIKRFLLLPNNMITSEIRALEFRNESIEIGFEGAIFRNPNSEYQFGKRNNAMIKFKTHTDGLFTILDIVPEGIKRPDIPLFVCKNDINEHTFNARIGGDVSYQKQCLIDKNKLIGKKLYIEYGERSGIKEVPFHLKLVKLEEI